MIKINKLTRQEKEAIGLLSIGTFLEYFDLMLYVHMAILLNELFFPQADPLTAKLLGAAAFCSTFILRPVGGFFIGWIGDKIGRKSTIMITTFLMAASCATIAITGTYQEIGITASIIIILCRMAQGFSSLGEVIGAALYLSEVMKFPKNHFSCGIIGLFSQIGGLFALIVSFFALSVNLNWRFAFLFGAGIALIGLMTRMRLKETPDFMAYKNKINDNKYPNHKDKNTTDKIQDDQKVNIKSLLCCMMTIVIAPASLYVVYVYFNEIMKSIFSLNTEQIITHNIKVSIISVVLTGIVAFSTKKLHPIKITKITLAIFSIFLILTPYLINNYPNLFTITILQVFFFFPVLTFSGILELSTWFKHFPVAKRFTVVATSYGISTAFGYTITSFGLIHLSRDFGYYSLWMIFIPMLICFYYSMRHLQNLEIKNGTYNNYPKEDNDLSTSEDIVEPEYKLNDDYESI